MTGFALWIKGRPWKAGAVAAGAVAAAVYVATMATAPVPGASAALIVKHAGLSEVPPMIHPLWNALCSILAAIPLGSLAVRVHIVCAILGAAAVYAAARLAATLAGREPLGDGRRLSGGAGAGVETENGWPDNVEKSARLAAGLAAGLMFAFNVPMWMASTRASTGALEALLLISALRVSLRHLRFGKRRSLVVAMLLWGLASAESPAAALHLPLGLGLAGWGLARYKQLPRFGAVTRWRRQAGAGWRPVASAFLALAIGVVAPVATQAVVFARSPAPAWLNLTGGAAIALAAMRAYYGNLKTTVSGIGWMLIALCAVAPAILYVWARVGAHRRGTARLGWIVLLLVCFSIAMIFNAPFAPWPMLGGPSPAVLPYLWISVWASLAMSALLRIFARRAARKDAAALPGLPGRILAGLMCAVALAAAALNAPEADGRAARPVGWLARGVVEETAGARWLISRGLWDDAISIAAHGRIPALRTMRWNLGRNDIYLRWIAGVFPDRPVLAGLALAGLEALAPVWLSGDVDAIRTTAALDLPEVFAAAGLSVAPGLWTYAPQTGLADEKPGPTVRELDRWRAEAAKMRGIAERARPPLREYGLLALQHASRVMNDRGVYLEDRARPEDAIHAYSAALAADGSNLVASVNLSRVVRSLGRVEAERIDRNLVRFLEEMPGPVDIVAMEPFYGRVRDPAVVAERGRRLASAGRFSEAVADFLEALALGGTNDAVAASAARALASQGRYAEGLEIVASARRSFPDSLALREVESHIATLSGAGAATNAAPAGDGAEALMARALADIARNDLASADEALRQAIASSPTNTEAVALSAFVGLRLGRPDRVRAAEAQLRNAGETHPLISLSLAGAMLAEQRVDEARHLLDMTLTRQPGFRPARELLIRMERETERTDSARAHVETLLRQFPGDPSVLFMLADIQVAERDYEAAEATMRHLLGIRRSPPLLNGLAWILWKRGRAEEALPLAREAAEAAPGAGPVRDTLAVVLYTLGRREEAASEIAEAERLSPDDAGIRDHAAAIRSGRPIP